MARLTEQRGNAPDLANIIPAPKGAGNTWLSYWSSPEALAGHVASLKQSDAWDAGAWTNGASFAGSKSMAESIDLCRTGWPDGAARVERLRDKINAANPTGPRVIRWDVAGAVASVPRALAGNPLNMRRIDSARLRRRPVLTLLSDMSANASVDANAVTNRAAVVAAIVDSIESKGFACHVVTFEHSRTGNAVAQIVAATIKEPSSPVDVGRMAFALGHASMFRRISWAAFTCDKFTSGLGSGLGVQTELDTIACNERGAYVLKTAGVNPSAFRDENTAATKGLAWLVNSLTEQGCPAFPADEYRAA
jgi:hypothetical protein